MASGKVEAGRGRGSKSVAAANKAGNMKMFYGAVAAVALLGVGAILYVSNSGKEPVVTLDPNVKPSVFAGYVMGNEHAPVEVVEFGDFECPGCGVWFDMTEPDVRQKLVQTGLIRFRFYDFPLPMHPNALSAHVAAGCADRQGKFWEMHDKVFAGQAQWNTAATSNPKKVFNGYAKDIGINTREWAKCYDDREPLPHIMANVAEGQRLGVRGTPTFIIGNKVLNDGAPFERIKAYVDSAIADTVPAKTPGRAARSGRGGQ